MENTIQILQSELAGSIAASLQMIISAMIISFFAGGIIGLILYLIILFISSSLIFVRVTKFPCKNESLESSSLK